MKTTGFLLFRLNFVDRDGLFEKPVANDDDFIKVIELSATQPFDMSAQGPRSGYRWSLRSPIADAGDNVDHPFIEVTFSLETTSRRGPIITADGIAQGTSTMSPPPATLVRIVIHLRRHILAIEDVPSVIQTRKGWRGKLETILSSAAWEQGFTSQIRLDPVIPAEVVTNRLESFSRVTRLRVTLSIPNPDLGPSFQHLYDEMKRGGVRELSEDMRNERGLVLGPETLPRAALDMAVSGYRKGKIHVYGYNQHGEKDEFTISDDVVRIEMNDVREFAENYAASRKSAAVKRFAAEIIKKIDESLKK